MIFSAFSMLIKIYLRNWILLTIPVTILFPWDGEKQEQKYREKFKAVLQEVATNCTKKEERRYIQGKDIDCTVKQLAVIRPQ